MAKLALTLHHRYSRREAFAAVGVEYDQQKRYLNVGLSPQCPDEGYLIFITLNKEGLDPAYDYDDELFGDKFRWVTRRDRAADHPDYLHLRESKTRISLLVRNNSSETFAYLGELKYQTHREFSSGDQRIQQEYVFDLVEPLPASLLDELTAGLAKRTPAKKQDEDSNRRESWKRRPASLDDYKKAFSYALAELDRTVVPGHHNYQLRLMKFLEQRGVHAEFERDMIDVRFEAGGCHFIGEIKITGWLRLEQAFRTAIGQLLEYQHLRCSQGVAMVMFLDQELDAQRLALASRLNIAVVYERGGEYIFQNREVSHQLEKVFKAIEKPKAA